MDTGEVSQLKRQMMLFAVPTIASSLLFAATCWVGYSILLIAAGTEAMGHFSIALFFYQMLVLVPQSMVLLIIPLVSEMQTQGSDRIRDLIVQYQKSVSTYFLPAVMGVALFSAPLIRLVYGPSFVSASESLYLMSSTSYVFTLWAIAGAVLVGAGRVWLSSLLISIWCACFVALDAFLIPIWGPNALALSFLISYMMNLIITFLVLDRKMNLRPRGMYVMSFVGITCLVAAFPFRCADTFSGVALSLTAWAICVVIALLAGHFARRMDS